MNTAHVRISGHKWLLTTDSHSETFTNSMLLADYLQANQIVVLNPSILPAEMQRTNERRKERQSGEFLYFLSTGDVAEGIEPHVFATRNPAIVWADCDGDERVDGMAVSGGELLPYCPTKEVVGKWYTPCTEERARVVDPEFFALMDSYCPLC